MNKKHDFLNNGSVYIAVNKTIVNPETNTPLLKVGFTQKDRPEERIDELSKETSSADNFELLYSRKISSFKQVEKLTHDYLQEDGKRYNNDKEFFTGTQDKIKKVIDAIADYCNTNAFIDPDSGTIRDDIKTDDNDKYISSNKWYSPYDSRVIITDIYNKTPDGLKPEIWERVREKDILKK
jgi:hypothetical protein